MEDKIITTIETTITWYCPTDCLPKENCFVFFKTKYNEIPYRGECTIFQNGSVFFMDKQLILHINDIEWWAMTPVFE